MWTNCIACVEIFVFELQNLNHLVSAQSCSLLKTLKMLVCDRNMFGITVYQNVIDIKSAFVTTSE